MPSKLFPSKHCCPKGFRLRFTVAVLSLVAVPQWVSAQQAQPQQYNNAAPQQQRRVAATPQQQRSAQQTQPQQQAQQRPAAGAPRQVQAAPQGTMPARRAPATAGQQPGQQQAGQQQAAQQQPGRQYPVRQAAGSEPLPQQGAPRQAAPAPPAQGPPVVVPLPPAEPFVLTAEQQRLLEQILLKWEKESDTVTRFECNFRRWEINKTFGVPENNYQISDALGDITYQAPDHGLYKVKSLHEWDGGQKAMVPRGEESFDHWVCNGLAIFEFNHKQKQLIERQLAPEMRGKAITDGPLPFVFGTKAAQLKLRYWMRDVTPADEVGKQIWLEAHPKQQRDAANFHHAFIILDQKTFMPSALRIVLPDGVNSQDYQFYNISKNSKLAVIMSIFDAPRTPFGWTKVVIPAGGEPTEQQPAQPPAQAQQPRAQTQR